MHSERDDLLVVGAVEDSDASPLREGVRDAPEEVVVELLGGGCLNETTWTPCGLTPVMTCWIALSFPAASIAWRTTRRAYVSLAQRSSCASDSSSMPRARFTPGARSN